MFRCLWMLVAVVILTGGCAAQHSIPEHPTGPFFLPDGSPASEEALAQSLADADYILVGERHNSRTDHLAQAAVLTRVAALGTAPVLGLEMLPQKTFDPVLRAFSEGDIPLERLPLDLHWKEVWGYDFALYEPVFRAAREHGIPIYGLNIPNALRERVSKEGLDALSRTERQELPSRIIPPLQEQREQLAAFFALHSTMLAKQQQTKQGATIPAVSEKELPSDKVPPIPMEGQKASSPYAMPKGGQKPSPRHGKRFERFLLIQSLWDSAMAERAIALRSHEATSPVIILAGSGHVSHGYGIAHRLRTLQPTSRIVLIMPFSGHKPVTKAADFFFHSPAAAGAGE